MMASRLYHRRHVIPALTDHLEDKGGVIGRKFSDEFGAFSRFKIDLVEVPPL
jgi:hypothetical protein